MGGSTINTPWETLSSPGYVRQDRAEAWEHQVDAFCTLFLLFMTTIFVCRLFLVPMTETLKAGFK